MIIPVQKSYDGPIRIKRRQEKKKEEKQMELNELLRYFAESDTIGENQAALDLMRYYSRQAQKITMEVKDVPPDTVVGGVPAKVIKKIETKAD